MSPMAARNSTSEILFSVPDMMCEGCEERLTSILRELDGVERVKASAWRKRVRIRFDPVRVDAKRLKAALAMGGFEAIDVRD